MDIEMADPDFTMIPSSLRLRVSAVKNAGVDEC